MTRPFGPPRLIRVHRQAMQMYEYVRRHLEQHPQDGTLFAIDFERALGDLGFSLSSGMRAHLAERLPARVDDDGSIYEAVRAGQATPPVDLNLDLALSDESTGELAPPRSHPLRTSDTSVDQGNVAEELVAATRLAASAPREAAGYSVLLQLSDALINRVVGAAYDADVIPHQWSGVEQIAWDEFRIEIDAGYEVEASRPVVSFDTSFENGVAIDLGVSGRLELRFRLLQLTSPLLPEFEDTVEIDLEAAVRAIGTAVVAEQGNGKAAVELNLRDLRDLVVTFQGEPLPPVVRDMAEAVLARVAQVELGEQSIPLTFLFESAKRAGVPIQSVGTRIRRPESGLPGTLSIGIDTTGGGNAGQIPHIIPGGMVFASIATEHLLVGQAWPPIAATFPITVEGIEISEPELALHGPHDGRPGHIYFRVKAKKQIDCLPDVNATATVLLVFESFEQDGVHRTRLKSIHEDIDVDFWDQLFYSALFGLLLSPFGLGAIGMIVFNVVLSLLEGLGEVALGNAVESMSVGFRAKIPGTRLIAEASTPIEPEVREDHIFAAGDAVFYEGTN